MSVGYVVAERLLYVPSAGFVLLIAYILDCLCSPSCEEIHAQSSSSSSEKAGPGRKWIGLVLAVAVGLAITGAYSVRSVLVLSLR
jgi:uncharacterized membrane protein